ncbi:MAG: MoaD/ThiS family protein [Campylobacterota bacterium]|nr:MoaD/ThiS family protein [Campylobacterota bacterium]
MVTVEFLGPISKEPMSVDITNLEQLSEILKGDESLKPWLQNSAVAINDVLVQDKSHSLNDGDKVSLLPPVCGG